MKIVADSCCDAPDGLRESVAFAPLTITVDAKEYVDDGTVDIPSYLAAMKASHHPARSACPSPQCYAELIGDAQDGCFVVTLSSRLSGSYNAAQLGARQAEEAHPLCRVHVFDSESASAGETYLALMIGDLIRAGRTFEEIIALIQEKIRTLHTLFVLDSLENLVKNGRVSRAIGLVAGVLSIRTVMSDDGTGGIRLLSKARGIRGALTQMVETCRKHTQTLAAGSARLVLSYCNCPARAREVVQMIRERCPAIGEIILAPTSALSSMYAYDGGIVIAY